VKTAKLRQQFEQYSQYQDVDGEIQKINQSTPGQDDTRSSKAFPDIETYVADEVEISRKSPGGSVALGQPPGRHTAVEQSGAQVRRASNAPVARMSAPPMSSAEMVLPPRQDEPGRPWPVVEDSSSHFVDPNSWPWWDIGPASNNPEDFSLVDISMMQNGY
jgi:hypothetical protein